MKNKMLLGLAIAGLGLTAALPARAGLSISIGLPFPPIIVGRPPIVVAAPPPPVVYSPAPVEACPAPVVVAAPPPVFVTPYYGYGQPYRYGYAQPYSYRHPYY